MATSKDPNKGGDGENASEPQQKSMLDFYKRKKCGRPKKHANLAMDNVEVGRKMPKKHQHKPLTMCLHRRRLPQLLFPNWMMEKTIIP
jgi:hypothetical protein